MVQIYAKVRAIMVQICAKVRAILLPYEENKTKKVSAEQMSLRFLAILMIY